MVNKEYLKNFAKKINNRYDFDQFIMLYKEYLSNVMIRDIPNVDYGLKIRATNEIIDFITQGVRKGYITKDNLSICLERLIETTQKIKNISGFYGKASTWDLGLNFNSPELINNMKHYVFHELTHSITDICGSQDPRINSFGRYAFHEERIVNNIKHHAYYEYIIPANFMVFLNEIMAESTACDLANSYFPRKRSAFASPNYIESDWHTPYNQTYQQLGFEFIRTFLYPDSNEDERTLFKRLTLLGINSVDIGKIILENAKRLHPESFKEDLHTLTYSLAELINTHSLNDEEVKSNLEILSKYRKTLTTPPNCQAHSRAIRLQPNPNYQPHSRVIRLQPNPNYQPHSRVIKLQSNPNYKSKNHRTNDSDQETK